jgi:hypothetical protein
MKQARLNILDYMSPVNALEFVRILHEHKDAKGVVKIDLGHGMIVDCQLDGKFNPPRSIDSPPTPEDER